MHQIKDLIKITGRTEHEIRGRLDKFSELLNGQKRRGNYNRILLTDNGLTIFERILELEDQGRTPEQIRKQIESELGSTKARQNGNKTQPKETQKQTTKLLEDRIKELETWIEDLKQDKQEYKQQMDRLFTIIENRLPPAKSPQLETQNQNQNTTKGKQKISETYRITRWERFKQLIKGE